MYRWSALCLLIALAGCSDESVFVKDAVKTHTADLSSLQSSCIKLGQCMGGKYNIVHFSNQSNSPFACEVNMGPWRSYYFYPDSSLMFGDLGRGNFENAIVACNLLKKTGDYSDSYIEVQKERMKEWERDREKRKIKPKPSPTPTIEIKEYH